MCTSCLSLMHIKIVYLILFKFTHISISCIEQVLLKHHLHILNFISEYTITKNKWSCFFELHTQYSVIRGEISKEKVEK